MTEGRILGGRCPSGFLVPSRRSDVTFLFAGFSGIEKCPSILFYASSKKQNQKKQRAHKLAGA